ncbi:MAG: carboxypeptidase-like regulatory domain-containing protein, partial [Deferrisomatales bacterium]|nr:carboxypeptidase-like regulatory domain-containing protein [Deferrisomatales bacterium]
MPTGAYLYPQVLVIDPVSPSTLYIGTRLDGVFRSNDSGTNWTPFSEGLKDPYSKEIYALAHDPSLQDVIYAGTIGAGVFINHIDTSVGTISGTVIAEDTELPLENVSVCADSAFTEPVQCTQTDANGDYTISGLPVGDYMVRVDPANLLGYSWEYYGDTFEWDQATTVGVAGGTTTGGIDFVLAVGATVSGTIRADGTGFAIEGVQICAGGYGFFSWSCGFSGPDGTYQLVGLPAGEFTLCTYHPLVGYVAECYEDVYDENLATPVVLTAGNDTGGIDFSLAPGGSIEGFVLDGATGQAVVGATVCADPLTVRAGQCTTSGDLGEYLITGLAADGYRVRVDPGGLINYSWEYYPGTLDETLATAVVVTAGLPSGPINFTLDPGGTISGTVFADGGGALQGVDVCATSASLGGWYCGTSDAAGAYQIPGLPALTDYRVEAYGDETYAGEYYNDTYTWGAATLVAVTAGNDTPGIDFGLALFGSISGTVTADGGGGLPGITVCATSDSVGWGSCATTEAGGTYQLIGLRTLPDYRVEAHGNGSYVGEYYDDTYDWNAATLVAVTAGNDRSGTNFSLAEGGSISGTVTADGGGGLPGITVCATSDSVGWGSCASTEAGGTYQMIGLRALPDYRVEAHGDGSYVGEYYDDTYDWNAATLVAVTAGNDRSGTNFSLAEGGSISGTVTADGGGALEGVDVCATSASLGGWYCGTSDAAGVYQIPGLRALPDYRVQAYGDESHLGEYYDDTYDWNAATLVAVTAGNDRSGTNFSLALSGSISGAVTADGGADLPGITVCANSVSMGGGSCATTDTDSTYQITGLQPLPDYRVQAHGGGAYVGEYYDDTNDWDAATLVTVTAGNSSPGIDFSLAEGGSISGTVTDGDTGAPIADIWVCANSDSLGVGNCDPTGADGVYHIEGLRASADYRVQANGDGSHVGEYYDDTRDWSAATLVAVTAGTETSAIDFGLAPAGAIIGTVIAEDTSLPLEGFQVTVRDSRNSWYGVGSTDASGAYEIASLPTRLDYRVTVDGDETYSYRTAQGVSVTAPADTVVDFVLPLRGPDSGITYVGLTHESNGDGSETDSLDLAFRGDPANISSVTAFVDGPNGFHYDFVPADQWLNNLELYKEFPSLEPGLYTFTLTDEFGLTHIRTDTHAPNPIPRVDESTIQYERRLDGSYRFSWAPVNAPRTYYYRLRLFGPDGRDVKFWPRAMSNVAVVEAGLMTDGLTYTYRVEVHDAPTFDLLFNRSETANTAFTPQNSDYDPDRVEAGSWIAYNQVEADGTEWTTLDLTVADPGAVTLAEVTGPGFHYTFDRVADFNARWGDWFNRVPGFLTPGLYTFHYVANDVDHYVHSSLTPAATYPAPDPATWQVEETLGGQLRFSWAGVNHTGALYYRVYWRDTLTGAESLTGRSNQAYADISPATLGDLANKEWRVEVHDSSAFQTLRNRRNGPWVPLNVIPYDPG